MLLEHNATLSALYSIKRTKLQNFYQRNKLEFILTSLLGHFFGLSA